MDNFGWQRADPIASIFIAIMTLISVKPLLTETTQVLLQRSPAELDSKLPQIYQQLATIGLVTNISEIMSFENIPCTMCTNLNIINQLKDGVTRLEEAHAWTLCSGQTVCTVKLKTHAPQNNVM